MGSNMQFGKAILSGVVLWAILFALGSILMTFGLATTSTIFSIFMLVLVLVIVWIIVTYWYVPKNTSDAFLVGLVWFIINAVIDYFVLYQYFAKDTGADYYGWSVLTGYGIILLFPVILKTLKK